jgi:hypothetical protein
MLEKDLVSTFYFTVRLSAFSAPRVAFPQSAVVAARNEMPGPGTYRPHLAAVRPNVPGMFTGRMHVITDRFPLCLRPYARVNDTPNTVTLYLVHRHRFGRDAAACVGRGGIAPH